jgi:hypothetical protein
VLNTIEVNQKEFEAYKKASEAYKKASEANQKASEANQKAFEVKFERGLMASRQDARDLNLNRSANLMMRILYSKVGFNTKHSKTCPSTAFVSALHGSPSWDNKIVPGAQKIIQEIVNVYQNYLQDDDDSNIIPDADQICAGWDSIKDFRNFEQHGLDLDVLLVQMIGFYQRHIDLGDKLQGKDKEFFTFFQAIKGMPCAMATPAAGIAVTTTTVAAAATIKKKRRYKRRAMPPSS